MPYFNGQPAFANRLIQRFKARPKSKLVKTLPAAKGRDPLKEVWTDLIETARPIMEAMFQEITGDKVVSLHHEISTTTAEEIVLR